MLAVILIILVAVTFIILSKEYFGTYKNHYTLFNAWWAGLSFLSYLNLSPLFEPSENVYFIVFIGTLSFNLSLYTSPPRAASIQLPEENLNINTKLFIVCQILVAVFIFPHFLKGLAISQESSMAHLKAGLTEMFSKDQMEVIKVYWFCEPMIITSIFLSCFIFYFRKDQLYLILLTLTNVILFSFAFGGRIQMFRMSLILLIFAFFKHFITSDVKLLKRRTNISYIMIGGFIGLMSIFTQERSWGPATDYFKMFNIYFIGSFSLLDNFISHPNTSLIESDWLWGRATLASFIDPFILFGGRVLGIESWTTGEMGVNIINNVQERFYDVGKGYQMNAFPTMYYPFMRDFGLFGVILLPFIFGYILNRVIHRLKSTANLYYFIVYIVLSYILIFATNRWELVNFWPFGSLFYIYLLTSKRFSF